MQKMFLFILISLSSVLFAQEKVQIKFETGDRELNAHLIELNSYARSNMELFRKDMSDNFGVTRERLDRLITRDRYEPSDVYYGYNLSRISGKPFLTVMKMRSDKKGWGSIAKDLGIKPGSKEFHALKNGTLNNISKDRFKVKGYKNSDSNKSKSHDDKMKHSDKKVKVDDNQIKDDHKKMNHQPVKPQKN